jgi:GPH family glycoside/pentoside/hexuronide:cation symporter
MRSLFSSATSGNPGIHRWAVGSIAEYMLFVCFNALILPVFSTGFGLDPVLVGWALMLPRLTDAVIDPWLGNLTDHARTRWGRRRPFMAGAALVGAAMVVLIWMPSPEWSKTLQFGWLLAASIILYACYGLFSMSHMALGYELSDDYHVRVRIMAVRGAYFAIAAMAGGWLYWLALRPVFGGEINGVRWVSVGMAVALLAAAAVPVLTCRERFLRPPTAHPPLFKAIRSAIAIRPFAILLVVRIFQTLGGTLYGTMAFYITVYSVCGGDKDTATSLSGINGMVGFAVAFALVPAATWLSRRLGKRRGLIFGYAAAALGAAVLPFFALPGHPYLLLAHMILFGALGAVLTLFNNAVMPDICDLDELQSGERREGLFAAVQGFVSKIENSLCILLGGYLLSMSGFDAQAAQHAVQQAPEVIERLRWLAFTPNIVFAVVATIVVLRFPLTPQRMEEVRRLLTERRAAAQPTADPAPLPAAAPARACPAV